MKSTGTADNDPAVALGAKQELFNKSPYCVHCEQIIARVEDATTMESFAPRARKGQQLYHTCCIAPAIVESTKGFSPRRMGISQAEFRRRFS